jgi:signal transduction histidine kinase
MQPDHSSAEAELRRLTDALTLAERERQLLGFELHDGIVQDLTAAAMLLEGAERSAAFTSAEGQKNYESGVRLLQQSIAAARRLIGNLASMPDAQADLVSELAILIEKFRTDYSLPVAFVCDLPELKVAGSVQQLLLRIAHESLFNAWKHASAQVIEIRLSVVDDQLELVIADDGIGFDPAQVPTGRFGIEGIRARAGVLKAELLLDTAPQHGTRVVVRWRLPPS